jgi:phthiocerol/phenolphthiocerol synthesis type-I polyketide synthase A
MDNVSRLLPTRTWPWIDAPSCVLPLRAAGTRPPILFAHAAFPGLGFERMLAEALGDDQPFHVPTQWYFEQHGHPPFLRAHELAKVYASHVKQQLPRGPYCVLGYSAAGLSALELARCLVESNERVALILVEPVAPSQSLVVGAEPDDVLATAKLCEKVMRLSVDELRALDPEERLRNVVSDLARSENEDWARHIETLMSFDMSLARRYLRFFIAFARLQVHEDDVAPYRHPVVYIETETHERTVWQRLCPNMTTKRVPGSHLSLFKDAEHRRALAAEIRQSFDALLG